MTDSQNPDDDASHRGPRRLPGRGALDAAKDLLKKELLKGLEGEDIEMTAPDWDDIENEALKLLDAKKTR